MASSVADKALILITGANSGLGFELAKALYSRPEAHHILVGCRGDIERATSAISKLERLSPNSTSTAEPLSIDISSDDSIAAALGQVQQRYGHLDILVNNAGVDLETAINSGRLCPRNGWNETWDVNVTGTHLATEAFVPLLLKSKTGSARVLFITSGLSSITEHAEGKSPLVDHPAKAGWPKPLNTSTFLAYRATKAGLNMIATEWARLLHNDGVKVFNISPGFLDTGLGKDRNTGDKKDLAALGALDPAIGAGFCADVVQGKRDEQAWPTKVLRRQMVQPW